LKISTPFTSSPPTDLIFVIRSFIFPFAAPFHPFSTLLSTSLPIAFSRNTMPFFASKAAS